MKTLLAVAAFAFVAANAGAGIVPVQCVRASGAEIFGNDPSGDVSIQEFAERPFPPNSLENWDGGSSVSWNSHAIDVVGDSESTMLSGNTILHANLQAYVGIAPSGAGTQLNAVGSATVIFDFMVTDPVNAMIQSSFSTYGTVAVGGYLGAHAAMYRDGQFVAGWGLENGSASQEMVWEFGPGAWEITVFADAALKTDPSSPAQQGEAHMAVEITSVPAPGALAVAGILVLLGLRRRRGS
jgi:hypothetical protein